MSGTCGIKDGGGWFGQFVELHSEFRHHLSVPGVAARSSPYPWLFCVTPLASGCEGMHHGEGFQWGEGNGAKDEK